MQLVDFTHAGKTYTGWTDEDAQEAGLPSGVIADAISASIRGSLSCTPRQARLALAGADLLEAVEAWIATADEATRISWEFATEIRRDFPALAGAAAALELTEAQIDGLFEAAATL